MLQLKHIRKAYKTADFTQVALNDVSVTFRDSEFVAVLGPSGSGKTTMLNVLGGLDHADSGDIVVNGVSTKDFKAKDWDTYRNHRVGFIFQSYNLIPHQSVLSNVELALTLSGVGRAERRVRAKKALEDVGLAEHIHKHPSQLSGGQMQRVAIARALVNDPDIVLADEPTGALDTETGIQVMNILKGVAQDRLVVMVTHNPELAQQYATRIVRVRDGRIVDDSNPLSEEELAAAGQTRDLRSAAKPDKRASMSFLTALSLSFNNLWSKKGRTILTAFAGSIGIIGIAAILAVSNGVNNYIAKTEQDTLSNYPLEITKSSADTSSLMATMMSANGGGSLGGSSDSAAEESTPSGSDQIPETQSVSTMASEIKSNDLASFKQFLDGGGNGISDHTSSILYNYGITPRVYSSDTSSITRLGTLVDDSTSSSSMMRARSSFGMTSGLSAFSEMMDNQELLDSQYDVVDGRWPEAADEAVLVLGQDGSINDYTLYLLNVLDIHELQSLVEQVGSTDSQIETPDTNVDFTYDDALGLSFKVVSNSQLYQRNDETATWTDMSSDADFMRNLLDTDAIDLHVVGVVRPNAATDSGSLSQGIAYTHDLTLELMSRAKESAIVQAQLANPDVDVFTGQTFEELQNAGTSSFDLSSIFSVDEDALRNAFSFDTSALEQAMASSASMQDLDLSGLDMSSLASSMDLSDLQLDTSQLGSVFTADTLAKLAAGAPQPDFSGLLDPEADSAQFATLSQAAVKVGQNFSSWLFSDEGRPYLEKLREAAEQDLRDGVGQATAGSASGDEDAATGVESTDSANATGTAGNSTDGSTESTEVGEHLREAAQEIYEAYSSSDTGSTALEEFRQVASLSGEEVSNRLQGVVGTYVSEQLAPYLVQQMSTLMSQAAQVMTTQLTQALQSKMALATQSLGSELSKTISSQLQNQMSGLSAAMENAFSVDPSAFQNAIHFNMTSDDLTSLLMNYAQGSSLSYDNNLEQLGYADESDPQEIDLYPKSFEDKTAILSIIDQYNDGVRAAGEDDKVISYTDMVGQLMSSVTDIVNLVSDVLIAMVSISLVVSSIMIAIITYISVLERKKEIGILRAMGASKLNVANVFNAETVIEGFISGVFAIAVVLIVEPFVNGYVYNWRGVPNVMALSAQNAIALIAISVVLTLLAGLIPSSIAAKRDPVEALRSE